MRIPVRHLVTAALPYANGPLHIGHLAGCYLPADIYVRFLRSMGKEVLFVCGSDEHGAAITMRAIRDGITPREVVDKFHALFQESFAKIGVDFDVYHRTSDELHHETAQEFFRTLHKQGEFTEAETEQYYDEQAQQFLADRYIQGTCPRCQYDSAYGDQCEQCGASLNPTDLINPRSTLTGTSPVLKKTSHWYLPLDKHEVWLKAWIETGKLDGQEHHDPAKWKNHVVGQCKSWLDGGLQARAMTRDLDWGVDVPAEIPGSAGKKLYVWMDAPIGYISATKYWAQQQAPNAGEAEALWRQYWQDEGTELVHFIGKDNIVFHCLIFPAILKAHGSYVLPGNVPANQFMNLEGDKISTSRNWAVWVHEYLEEMPGKEDVLRFYLTKNMPEQKDSEFTWKGFQEANNNELVNNLANFINRVLVLTQKYYEGEVPEFDENCGFVGSRDDEMPCFFDSEMLDLFDLLHELSDAMRAYDFREALRILLEISSAGNQLLQFNEPWKQIKEDPDTVAVVMAAAMQYVVALSVAMEPFMPSSSKKLRIMLDMPQLAEGEWLAMLDALAEGEYLLPPGHKIGKSEHLFSRIDDELIDRQIGKLHQMKEIKEEDAVGPGIKPEIQFDDFDKIDLRTATVLEAERVPKTDKLMRLELDLGFERRTIVSGIAAHYSAEELVGKRVVIVANLAPRKMRGIESNGMVLMAENGHGELGFVSPGEDFGKGLPVK